MYFLLGARFSTGYTKIGLLRELFPGVPLIALSATADHVIRLDILAQLNIPDDRVVRVSFDRLIEDSVEDWRPERLGKIAAGTHSLNGSFLVGMSRAFTA